ncbi:MAG: hypothetical protein ACK4RK_10760 [Gemmataceae bacterium]
MTLKVPDDSELILLDVLRGNWGDLTLRLYQNDHTPSDDDTVADYAEADFSGYDAIPLLEANWSVATTEAGKAMTSYEEQTFEHDGGAVSNSIYGYYVVNAADELLWAERAAGAPLNMAAGGSQIKITPKFTLASEF